MAVITRSAHPKALWPGVRKWVMNNYNDWQTLYTDMFEVKSSTMAYEEDVEELGFALPTVKTEGAPITYTGHSQGYTTRYTHVTYGLGYIVTREEIEDNQYKSRAFKRGRHLSRSFRVAKETICANVFNRAFSSSYLGGDGKELIATDHPTISGNQSNELAVAADLSEASLEDLMTQIMEATDQRGYPINLRPMSLHIAPAEAFNAERIMKSTLQNDTANNAVNAIRSMGLLPRGVKVNPYLTNDDAWFIRTDAMDGTIMFQRREFAFSQDNDFDTENAKAKGTERYSVGWTDWRQWYGSEGAA